MIKNNVKGIWDVLNGIIKNGSKQIIYPDNDNENHIMDHLKNS